MKEPTIGNQSLKKASTSSKHEDVKKKRKKKRHQNHRMWGRKVRKYRFLFLF